VEGSYHDRRAVAAWAATSRSGAHAPPGLPARSGKAGKVQRCEGNRRALARGRVAQAVGRPSLGSSVRRRSSGSGPQGRRTLSGLSSGSVREGGKSAAVRRKPAGVGARAGRAGGGSPFAWIQSGAPLLRLEASGAANAVGLVFRLGLRKAGKVQRCKGPAGRWREGGSRRRVGRPSLLDPVWGAAPPARGLTGGERCRVAARPPRLSPQPSWRRKQ
jgi:hypothetical protein